MPPKKTKDRVRFYVKKPGGGRATFQVLRDQIKSGKRDQSKVTDERLDAINKSYKSGSQDFETCLIQVQEIIASLYKQHQRQFPVNVHNDENLKVFKDYWKYRYEDSGIERPEVAEDELLSALNILGPLSLYSASKEELQKKIDTGTKNKPNKQRRVIQRITAMLKFIGRHDIRLRKQKPAKHRVRHITEKDLPKLLARLDSTPLKALVSLCFYSGLRPGEAYALTPDSLISGDQIRVVDQLHFRNEYLKDTKNGVVRNAFLLLEGIEAFHAWTGITPEQMEEMKEMREDLAKVIKEACLAAFPGEPLKHLVFKDLRHCYAIQMVRRGVSLSLVAQSLGNTLTVCQMYYAGFVLTTDSVEAIRAIVARKKD